MNLTDIVKKIISEDTWGNNPSSAGAMSAGRSPSATTTPSPTARKVDISNLFDNFRSELDKQEKALIEKLKTNLKNSFLKKTIIINASKGSFGQLEKQYKITVTNVDIYYLKNWYYIIFVGNEGEEKENEYYLNKDESVIQVDDAAQSISPTGRTGGMSEPSTSAPETTKRNILPQG